MITNVVICRINADDEAHIFGNNHGGPSGVLLGEIVKRGQSTLLVKSSHVSSIDGIKGKDLNEIADEMRKN